MRKNKQITEDYLPKQMKILERDGGHNEPTRIRVDGVHTTSTSRKTVWAFRQRALFNKVLAHMEALKRQTRSITRFPTSKTPERPTPPDLSC